MTPNSFTLLHRAVDFIVIDKAPNVHFHSQDGSAGVVAQAEQQLQQKLYPVHRLDTPTSGLILLATSSASAARLADKFKQHQIQKYYLAIAKGKPKKKQGAIIGDMAKSRRGMHKLLRSTGNPAITQFFSHSITEGLRLYLLKPLTGRTHQLRVALASIGVPILGDPLYGKHCADRCYLHAYQLEFEDLGEQYKFTSAPTVGDLFHSQAISPQLIQWQQPLNWPKIK
ncbi:TIGR01621 family pseudouridine synthase [Parashewanella curva]|uniref:TIGR01621 family pseudouridine synthase n=1 Tax=Parashewanella curva TaxID=2338552 RepID=A0A3L8PZC2_9GAMM|nr:TIGR01621 family pseudouridine synthase [Parashewanella curva]RLV60747.1 TIGR01621 family pseudouridine synthase [Parashewanella curva]